VSDERSTKTFWKRKLRFRLNVLEAIPESERTNFVKKKIAEIKEKLNTRVRKGWRVICPACGHKFYRSASRDTSLGKEHK
jgi:hypothetical protein